VGSTFVFEIKLDKYNYQYRIKRFTVTRIFDNLSADATKENDEVTSGKQQQFKEEHCNVAIDIGDPYDPVSSNGCQNNNAQLDHQIEAVEMKETHSIKSSIKKPRIKK
jgi:hypothetical protein